MLIEMILDTQPESKGMSEDALLNGINGGGQICLEENGERVFSGMNAEKKRDVE